MDEITRQALEILSKQHPGKAIRLTHQFLDGQIGNECGFVPFNCDGGPAWVVEGQWWNHG